MLARLDRLVDAIGNTPLVRLRALEKDTPGVELYAKLEYANPGGSVKDRAARQMMLEALESGALGGGRVLIDSTSGNTGVAYAMLGAALGVPVKLVMPANVSQARKDITQAYGAELVFSDPMEGSDGAIRLVRALVAQEPERYFYPDQYSNGANPRAHYLGTGAELLADLGDRLTHFVTGVGTTGTVVGTSRRLKEHSRPIVCLAMQPDEALHGLEGLKHLPSSLVPGIYDEGTLDGTVHVRTEDGWDMSERLVHDCGLFVGHSSGGNVFAAWRLGKELAARGEAGCIATVLCDRGDRYFAPMKWR